MDTLPPSHPQSWLRVDFHCHTCYSKDSLTSIENLLEACRRKGIDRLVVSDHNTIAGAIQAKKIDPERIIIGEEIMTSQGELLAVYVSEEVPPNLAPLDAIQRLREQGAFISVSHPFDRLRSGSWQPGDLLRILPLVDAIEIFNARSMFPGANQQATRFARQHGLPGTAGSDAHTAFEVGAATFLLPPFHDTASLKLALQSAHARLRKSGWWVHLFSRFAVARKRQAG